MSKSSCGRFGLFYPMAWALLFLSASHWPARSQEAALSSVHTSDLPTGNPALYGKPETNTRVSEPGTPQMPFSQEVLDGNLGNAKGRLRITVFIDRATKSGKETMPELISLIAQEKDVEVVLKELPLASADSVALARSAAASRMQGHKASLVFEASMIRDGTLRSDMVSESRAKAAGLDMERLEKDRDLPEVSDYLNRTRAGAEKLGITSTPTFLIGNHAFVGLPSVEFLRSAVDLALSETSNPNP